ncbi:MAG: tRNA pseudouridine(13) synthase TruD [Planctomycetes bacterium]|nr:tRNA pseudouridine(13) synthase TruD [Planctomycetota bacterium]
MKYASAEIPACPGTIKSVNEDFRVFEVPLYDFSGSGDHTLVHVEKAGISTFEAIRRICRELKFNERDVGFAGLKDARGVTRQWLSFEHTNPENFLALNIPKLKVLEVTRHGNKLKRGHLAANRFEVVLRDVDPANVPHARATLDLLAKRGVPNWYDTQRFGRRGENPAAGIAILRGDLEAYFKAVLGTPEGETDTETRAAREAYEAGEIEQALQLWPRRANQERAALNAVLRDGATWKALKKLPQKLKLLQVSSVQSLLFNRVLDARFDEFDRVWEGDICRLANGADFAVEDPTAEQPRCDALEISPTGPIYGHKARLASGRAGELEQRILADAGLSPEMWDIGRGLSQKGDRRPFRFVASETAAQYDQAESALSLRFTLPKGCYATVLLKEITRTGEDLAFSSQSE